MLRRCVTRAYLFASAVLQIWSNRFDCSQSHSRRRTGSKNAVDQFFPKLIVRSISPQLPKLIQSRTNFFPARVVCGTYVVDSNRPAIGFHWIVNVQILGLRFERCQRNWTLVLTLSQCQKLLLVNDIL